MIELLDWNFHWKSWRKCVRKGEAWNDMEGYKGYVVWMYRRRLQMIIRGQIIKMMMIHD